MVHADTDQNRSEFEEGAETRLFQFTILLGAELAKYVEKIRAVCLRTPIVSKTNLKIRFKTGHIEKFLQIYTSCWINAMPIFWRFSM